MEFFGGNGCLHIHTDTLTHTHSHHAQTIPNNNNKWNFSPTFRSNKCSFVRLGDDYTVIFGQRFFLLLLLLYCCCLSATREYTRKLNRSNFFFFTLHIYNVVCRLCSMTHFHYLFMQAPTIDKFIRYYMSQAISNSFMRIQWVHFQWIYFWCPFPELRVISSS